MSNYEPGTVAVATVRGVPNVRVMKSLRPAAPVHDWFSMESIDGKYGHPNADVTDIRPLVVLDNEFPRTIVKHLRLAYEANPALTTLAWVADQIEQQTRPPKPPEPTGLGAVVEDVEGERWIRTCVPCDDCLNKPWQQGPMRRNWLIVHAVRVLSEGVHP